MISIRSLNKYFNKGKGNEIHVINDVSLELPERGMVAVFGKSGCGKTTLLNVIGGLDEFDGGSLTVEGIDIRSNPDELRNRYMGYIFQNYNLNKEESCFDNVADALRLCGMTDKNEIEKRVMAALRNVGMDHYRQRTPDTLSGGQQQRIAIARAIVKNPRIILADEPTGNLDDANTVAVMDLLKQIAKEHLVLLVTHEAHLVDYYCDTVIELKDGKAVNVRQNAAAHGYSARDKNDIFLGELEKTELHDGKADVEFYGDVPEQPVKLKIVHSGGKLYLRIDTPKVQILDESSEVKLREGVYVREEASSSFSERIDMLDLPPVQGRKFGRLFTFASAVKSGYATNFAKRKKGKKFLCGLMGLFAAVLVLISASFGTAFADLKNASESYNHRVFYVYTPDAEVSEKLAAAVGAEDSGIDYVNRYAGSSYSVPYGDLTLRVITDYFETFYSYQSALTTNAVYMDVRACANLSLAEGTKEAGDYGMLITTAVADGLLESSTLGFISEYKDLIGLVNNNIYIDGNNLRIVGIVRSDESAVYLSELTMAKYIMNHSNLLVAPASAYGMEVASGEAAFYQRYDYENIKYPAVGDSVKINGLTFTVSSVQRIYDSYSTWLDNVGDGDSGDFYGELERYTRSLMTENYPDCEEGTAEYEMNYAELQDRYYFDFLDRYYSRLDEYIAACHWLNPSFASWLAVEKGIADAKFYFADHDMDYYYWAYRYKESNGNYPSLSQVWEEYDSSWYDVYSELLFQYEQEYYMSGANGKGFYDNITLLSDADFIAVSRSVGDSDAFVLPYYYYYDYGIDDKFEDYDYDVMPAAALLASADIAYDSYYHDSAFYTVVHSADPAKTKAYLESAFTDLKTNSSYLPSVITPDDVYDNLISDSLTEITSNLVALVVTIVLMCVCMYFIMRSSIMARIKEIGIYRAIGVSKKNLVFRFLIESMVLTTLTVFIGYLLMSLFMACLGTSSLMATILYYPVWMAICVLILLYGVCLLFGVIPVLSLLRKTPSEILAKYDI